MAEVLVIGKKISEMGLVNEITGEEKIPTSALGDKAVTTGQLLTYVNNNGVAQWGRIGGDITNQVDLQNQFTQQLATLQNHIQDQGNPHNVTKEQVGLGLVDNTADMDKPVSTAVQEALSLKADQTYVDDSLTNKTHNSLLGRDADGVHPSRSISDASGVTQQEINDLTGAPYRIKVGGYNIGERVVLENGDIVQNIVTGNTVDPNIDMTGWVYANDAEIAKHAVYVPNGGGSVGVIGGTFRGFADGVQFIQDTDHAPFGTTGISKSDTYTVKIDHAFSASKVGTMTFCPDESFAAMGVIAGASVAQNFSLTKIIAPLYFTCKGDGTITKVSPLFEGSVTTMAGHNPAGGILRFSHPLKSVAAHQAIAVNRSFADNIARPVDFGVFNNDGGTYTQINVYGDPPDNNVWIRYNNTSAAFEAVQGIYRAQYNFSYNASTGGLTITHPTVKTGAYLTIPIIAPFNTNKRYVVTVVSANTTTIVCYDPAGNIVKNLDVADWNFFFSIKPSSIERVLEPIPATAEFTVFVGNCYVPIDNLKNVASGNIWFQGAMDK